MTTPAPVQIGPTGRRRRLAAVLLALTLLGLLLAAVGVVRNRTWIGVQMLVHAPNHGRLIDPDDDLTADDLHALGMAQALRVEVGPPAASLSVWIVDPPGEVERVRGTVLYLHGIGDRKETLLATAVSHAARGYRGVLVDARGHGRSSGEWATFGAQEVADYRQLLDELERRGLLGGRLAVYGASFGAGTAVQLGGRDARVATVVALAPFQSIGAIARSRSRAMGLGWLFDDATVDRVLDEAATLTACDLRLADGVAAQKQRPTPLLIFHGDRDTVIPAEQSAALLTAADPASRRIVIAGPHIMTGRRPGTRRSGARRPRGWIVGWRGSEAGPAVVFWAGSFASLRMTRFLGLGPSRRSG